MPFDDAHDLAPETIELYRRIAGRPKSDFQGTDEVMLGAFACGISTPEQEATTLSSLIHSREMRYRLKEVESQLQAMRSVPYSKIDGSSFSPVLIHCIRGAMQASMRVYCRARHICGTRGWLDISQARDLEAKAVRAIIGSIGETIQSLLSNSGSPYLKGNTLLDPSLPEGLEAHVKATILDDGALTVNGILRGDLPDIGILRENLLSLELIDPNGGSIPIGQPITSSKFSVLVEGFAEISGLESGSLPGGLFRIGLKGSPLFRGEGRHLFASAAGSNDRVAFGLEAEPTIEREHLILSLRAPDSAPVNVNSLSLNLSVPIGSVIQSIALLPLKEWNTEVQTIRCPVSGVVDGQIECGSIIHARLVRNEG